MSITCKPSFSLRGSKLIACAFSVFAAFNISPALVVGQLPNYVIYGTSIGDSIGTAGSSLVGNVDFNGDGQLDMAIGAPAVNGGTGAIFIHSGTGQVLATLNGSITGNQFGYNLASAGDLNRDGYPDLLISSRGTPACPSNQCTSPNPLGNYVRAISGQNWSTLYTISGGNYTSFGQSIATIGDIDGDGRSEFAVGASHAVKQFSCSCSAARGRVFIYSGASGSLRYAVTGSNFGDFLGQIVGGVGDLNADSIPDFAAVLHLKINVYSGLNGALLFSVATPLSSSIGSLFKLTDVDGDGKPDFIVSDSSQGVRLRAGSTGTTIWTATGNSGEGFGISAAVVGDVDLDGIPDIIVGSVAGYTRILSGATGLVLNTFTSGLVNDGFGNSVTGLGDVNADGLPDYAIGAPTDSSHVLYGGSVNLFYGPNGLSPSNGWVPVEMLLSNG